MQKVMSSRIPHPVAQPKVLWRGISPVFLLLLCLSTISINCSSTGFYSLLSVFGLGCVIVLVLSFATLLSAIFWLFPRQSRSRYDSHEVAKLNASVQACFRLQKPASEVISHKGQLEMDIFWSLDLRNTKVTILSLHQSGASNFTDVNFGVLPLPNNSTITKDSLTSLRSSFVNLFAQRSNLNLTTSTFGKPTSFEVLEFPGGITLDPRGFEPVSGVLEILFSFTLDISLSEIQDKLDHLKSRLKIVLCLGPFENVRVLLTNHKGSTISPPVTVKGCVISTMTTMENHVQQRSDHLAQARAKNLGLDNSVFGEAKSITFQTYLKGKIFDSASVLEPAETSCLPSLC